MLHKAFNFLSMLHKAFNFLSMLHKALKGPIIKAEGQLMTNH